MSLAAQGFYSVKNIEVSENKINAEVLLNSEHRIFEGHFPGQPIVPGVCQMQMLREVTEQALEQLYRLQEAKQIKFLHFINPIKIKELTLEIHCKSRTEATVEFSASIYDKQQTEFLKMNGIFVIDKSI